MAHGAEQAAITQEILHPMRLAYTVYLIHDLKLDGFHVVNSQAFHIRYASFAPFASGVVFARSCASANACFCTKLRTFARSCDTSTVA